MTAVSYSRRSPIRVLTNTPQSVILAGRRGSSYGYVVTRSVTQPRRKPRYFGGEAAGCVQLRRTRIYPGFARIIPPNSSSSPVGGDPAMDMSSRVA